MSVKAINTTFELQRENSLQKQNKKNNRNNPPSFTGVGNPITIVMDAIDRGGFAASFIAQDGIGMVAPRIWEGLNRNRKREKDPVTGEETGKKTGPLNWEFARREAIREILSGPSAFIIPGMMLWGIKRLSGSANNVHIDHINALGKSFTNFAEAKVSANKADIFADSVKTKEEFYEKVFKNVLSSSLDNKLNGDELTQTAREFTKEYMAVEEAPSKGHWKTFLGKKVDGSAEDLQGALVEKYMNLRKKLLPSSINEMDAVIPVEGTNKKVNTSFTKVLSSLSDYSNDVIKHSKKYIEQNGADKLGTYIKNLNHRRVGTRIMSIGAMFAAVVGFYDLIPKLYNLGLKHDPGLAGLEDETSQQNPSAPANNNTAQAATATAASAAKAAAIVAANEPKADTDKKDKDKTNQKDPAFTGAFQTVSRKLGEFATDNSLVQKAVKKFEFDGPSMSVPAMLTLLFGFCLPQRYKNAKSDKERKEILVRDISSFSAILFGANALSRLTSDIFGKMFGLVLNVKPQDHDKSIFHAVKNYLTPGKGIDVLKGAQIDSKYSNLENYKDRIVGFVDFLEDENGNAKKVFNMDKGLRAEVEKILGKPLKEVSISELRNALKAADDELLQGLESPMAKAMKNIYAKFGPNNKFINIAKTCNSTFGLLSTLALVPAFMIAVARYCENMTKKQVEEEKAAKAAPAAENAKNATMSHLKNMLSNVMPSQKPTMTGFLNS